MELGTNTSFLLEFLSHIDINGRVIVLADLAELGHDYKAGDMLKTYKELKSVCESWNEEDIDDFRSNISEFVIERYLAARSEIGYAAMGKVMPIFETDGDSNSNDHNSTEDGKSEGQKKFEKEAGKNKKSEQSPIAKATRSKGQNQDDMASATHVDKSTISRWKTGKRKPSFDNLKKLKSQYGMAVVNQLLGT